MRHYDYLPDDLSDLTAEAFGAIARKFSSEVVGGDAGVVLGVLADERALLYEALGAIGRADEFVEDPKSFAGCPDALEARNAARAHKLEFEAPASTSVSKS